VAPCGKSWGEEKTHCGWGSLLAQFEKELTLSLDSTLHASHLPN